MKPYTKKIALVGNMNNGNFAIMRYFRDLGADAHLLTYINDGSSGHSHFSVESDTWDIDRWRPFIHKIDLWNGYPSIIGRPKRLHPPPSRSKIADCFRGYEAFVGTGLTPAILRRIDIDIDIFWPYAAGIEFVGSHDQQALIKSSGFISRILLNYVARKQLQAIKRAKNCLNAEMSLTAEVLNRIKKPFKRIPLPALYNREIVPREANSDNLIGLQKRLACHDFSVFCHSRQLWQFDPCLDQKSNEQASKNSDWLIRGFHRFILNNPNSRSLLVLVEYGRDVKASKELVQQLGIQDRTYWMPIMPRKEIMQALKLCDVCVGEFYIDHGVIWGGTGWEVLASGRPLLQSFNFTSAEFCELFGHESPPILDAKSVVDIESQINLMYHNKQLRERIGRDSLNWFNTHNGIELARKWLEILDFDDQQSPA
jgi:hypothetical protein